MKKKRLGDLCTIVSGGTPSRSTIEYWDSGNIPWIKISNIKGKYVTEADEFITQAGLDNSSAKMLTKGTILFTIFATLGEVGILDFDACTNQAIAGIIIRDTSELLTEYLYYYLKAQKNYVAAIGRGVAQSNINMTILRSFEVPVPSIQDQLAIVKLISRAEKVIQVRQRQLHIFDTLIKARFVEMFGDITATVPLSFYIESLTAGKSLAGEEECQYKVLKTGAATYDYFDSLQVKNLPLDYLPLPEHQIHDGDVIISRMNTAELVGAAAYVWKAPAQTYLPDRLWRAELTDKANPIFVWQAIIQPTTKSAIKRIAGGTSGSMKNISKPGLLSLPVRKVDLTQQEQFATFVSQVDKSKVVECHSTKNIRNAV